MNEIPESLILWACKIEQKDDSQYFRGYDDARKFVCEQLGLPFLSNKSEIYLPEDRNEFPQKGLGK